MKDRGYKKSKILLPLQSACNLSEVGAPKLAEVDSQGGSFFLLPVVLTISASP
jgi:hypothetical protein